MNETGMEWLSGFGIGFFVGMVSGIIMGSVL